MHLLILQKETPHHFHPFSSRSVTAQSKRSPGLHILMWSLLRDGMKIPARRYATIASGKSSLRGKKGPPLTLEHFVQRGRALALWRDIVRSTNKVPPSSTRTELLDFARAEFERHRHVNDIGHIRYLISTGKTQLDSMKRYVEQQGM
ncbi:hypothetical protein WHR41_03847 [Cladosporium halotolerans]|uniref:LYR motif-containing protein 2 n=1 Tax=Cladosporium halotolerans TaxID=1052096 RepID=A0AB34KQS9_9PEZI